MSTSFSLCQPMRLFYPCSFCKISGRFEQILMKRASMNDHVTRPNRVNLLDESGEVRVYSIITLRCCCLYAKFRWLISHVQLSFQPLSVIVLRPQTDIRGTPGYPSAVAVFKFWGPGPFLYAGPCV